MCDPTVGGQVRQGHGAENGELRCGYRAPFMKCGMPWDEDKQRAERRLRSRQHLRRVCSVQVRVRAVVWRGVGKVLWLGGSSRKLTFVRHGLESERHLSHRQDMHPLHPPLWPGFHSLTHLLTHTCSIEQIAL
jgi:hypothetical protein